MNRISDSSPVQFWPNGKKTFNETDIPLISKKKWNHPWNQGDLIRIPAQFDDYITEGFVNPDFETSIVGWVNNYGDSIPGGSAWFFDGAGGAAGVSLGDFNYTSLGIMQKCKSATSFKFHITGFTSSSNYDFPVSVRLNRYRNDNTLIGSDEIFNTVVNNSFDVEKIYADPTIDHVAVYITAVGAVGPITDAFLDLTLFSSEVTTKDFVLRSFLNGTDFYSDSSFLNLGGNNYRANFSVSDLTINYKKLQFYILKRLIQQNITSLNSGDWVVQGGGTGVTFTETEINSDRTNEVDYELPQFILNGTETYLRVKYTVAGAGTNGFLTFKLQDDAEDLPDVVGQNDFVVDQLVNGVYEYIAKFKVTGGDATKLKVFVGKLALPGSYTVTLEFEVLSFFTDSDTFFKSDCISIYPDYEPSILVAYSNTNDFDGIAYEISPTFYYLRIPAHFWEESEIMEEEDEELSSGIIISLRNKVETKRLLRLIDFVPDYFHKKLRRVLMHDTIIIDELFWKRKDEYQQDRPETSTLSLAQVLLTQYDSVLTNIGGDVKSIDSLTADSTEITADDSTITADAV